MYRYAATSVVSIFGHGRGTIPYDPLHPSIEEPPILFIFAFDCIICLKEKIETLKHSTYRYR